MQIGRTQFGRAEIAWTDAAACTAPTASVWDRLGEQQARRHAALSGIAAQRFLAGRVMLLALITQLTDSDDLGFTTTCERCGADHGRPRLQHAPVAVSVSYAGPVVAVAAVRLGDANAVGIDIERRPLGKADEPLHELANLFGSATPPDIAQWTMLEAVVKADGRGIRLDLSTVHIGEPSSGVLPGSRAVRVPGREHGIDTMTLTGPAGFVLSAAIVPADPSPESSR